MRRSGSKRSAKKLRSALNQAIADAGLEGACTGLHTNPAVTLKAPDGIDASKISTLFIQEMARRGVHTYMSFKATLAHSDEDIRLTGEAASEALQVVRAGMEQGNLDDLIVAVLKKEPFRRLVR